MPLWAHLHYTWTEKRRRFVRGLILERRWKVVDSWGEKILLLDSNWIHEFPTKHSKHEMPICSLSGPRELRFLRNFFEFLCVLCVRFVFEGSRDTHESTNRSHTARWRINLGQQAKGLRYGNSVQKRRDLWSYQSVPSLYDRYKRVKRGPCISWSTIPVTDL